MCNTNLYGISEDKLEYFDYRCAYCGRKLTEKNATKDHVFPKFRKPKYVVIVPCCKECNRNKGCELLENWYKDQLFYTDEQYDKILQFIEKYKQKRVKKMNKKEMSLTDLEIIKINFGLEGMTFSERKRYEFLKTKEKK